MLLAVGDEMRLAATTLAAVLLFSASAASPAQAIENRVFIYKTHDDKFSKSISFEGFPESVIKVFGTSRTWSLRSWIDKKTLAVTHQLVVNINYNGSWKFYEAAADENANTLEFTTIGRETGSCGGLLGCDLTENVGVGLDDEMLRAKATSGFQIKLTAKSGDGLILDITPAQIQSELLTANQFLPAERRWSVAGSPQPVAPVPAAAVPSTTHVILGASFVDLTPAIATSMKLPSDHGIFTVIVRADSAASRAGLTIGDIILAFDDKPVARIKDLLDALTVEQPGSTAVMHVLRGGKPMDLNTQF